MAGLEDFYATQSCPPRTSGIAQPKRRLDPVYTLAPGASAAPDPSMSAEKYADMAVGITGLFMEHVASHPFLVIRRQCQVNYASFRYHRTPLTLVPVLLNLNRTQGLSVLWKGIGSTLTVRGLTLAVEDCISKLTPWPKEIDRRSSLRMLGQHLLLKASTVALLTPFYAASLVESVQSDIASEKPGFFDVFREGLHRIWNHSCGSGRMLPVWVLIPCTVTHGVLHYILFTIGKGLTRGLLQKRFTVKQQKQGAISKDSACQPLGLSQYRMQVSSLVGMFLADTLLYPMETVLHRLYLQGSRAIIDNLDSGVEVMPILTRYEGFFDCLSTIVQEEGPMGLFKGFGSIVLQYGLHFCMLRAFAGLVIETAKILDQDAEITASNFQLPARDDVSSRASSGPKSFQSNQSSPAHSILQRDRSIGDFVTPSGQSLSHETLSTRKLFQEDSSDV